MIYVITIFFFILKYLSFKILFFFNHECFYFSIISISSQFLSKQRCLKKIFFFFFFLNFKLSRRILFDISLLYINLNKKQLSIFFSLLHFFVLYNLDGRLFIKQKTKNKQMFLNHNTIYYIL